MDKKKLEIDIGDIRLKNPIICGSAEHFIEKAGIMNAINMGAAAVVAKSSNESNAAKIQLDKTDYSLIDSKLDNINWKEKKDIDTSLFGRSGLIQLETEEWLNKISILDNEAAKENAFVIASLIPSDLDCLIKYAEIANNLGIRILEVNIGAPHGVELDEEIKIIRKEDIVKEIVKNVRDVFKGSLWIKIAGVTENVIEISAASKEQGADAVVMIGRMMAMIPDIESMDPILGTNGAYGGRWALPITCRWLSETRKLLGNEYPLIGTNGVRSGEDVVRMILSGATAVEMTSAIFMDGFDVIPKTLHQLSSYLDRKNASIKDIIGITADRVKSYGEQEIRPNYWKKFVPDDSLN